jgi:hypothetical protein
LDGPFDREVVDRPLSFTETGRSARSTLLRPTTFPVEVCFDFPDAWKAKEVPSRATG